MKDKLERLASTDQYGDNGHSLSKAMTRLVAMSLVRLQRGRRFIIASDFTHEHVVIIHNLS